MAPVANTGSVALRPAIVSSTYLNLEATEQVPSPTSSSNISSTTSSTKSPAKYNKVVEIRTDHDIRQFRRNLPKLIAAMVKPDASTPPQVDIFFKRTPVPSSSSVSTTVGAGDKSSKSGFEAKVKECLASGQPLKVTYTLRDAEPTVKKQSSKTPSNDVAAPVASTPPAVPTTIKDVAVAVATHDVPAAETKVATPSTPEDWRDAIRGVLDESRSLHFDMRALMNRHVDEANKNWAEAEARICLLKEELNASKSAQRATAALLKASQTHVDQLVGSLANLERLPAAKDPLHKTEDVVADRAHLQGKASSIVGGMKDFLAAYAKLMGPDEQELSYSTGDNLEQQQQSTTKPTAEASQKDGVVHPDIFCDGACDAAVRGLRWKCISCPDFDFCDSCYQSERETHVKKLGAKHLFLAIHHPMRFSDIRIPSDRMARLAAFSSCRTREAAGAQQGWVSKGGPWRKPSAVVNASAPPQTAQTSATKKCNVSVQLLPEPIPASSELSAQEKSNITQKIVGAGADIGQKLKDLLHNQQQIPENVQRADEYVVDVDYLTRAQYDQILALCDQQKPTPSHSSEDTSTTPPTQARLPAQTEHDAEDEKLGYDAVLTSEGEGRLIVAKNTGSLAWHRDSLSLRECRAGGAWSNAGAMMMRRATRTQCRNLIQPGECVKWVPGWASTMGTSLNFRSKEAGQDAFFRMAITHPNGTSQRFGEQLMLPASPPASAVPTSGSNAETTSPVPSSQESKEADAPVEETVNAPSKSLSGSSVLTIPAAPEVTHTDEEAALAVSIPSRPVSREREDEESRSLVHSAEAKELSSQHTGRTEESIGDALRSPSYEGGSTNSERDPFDSLADEEEVFLDEQDEDEDTFIVIDAGTDEESVVGA